MGGQCTDNSKLFGNWFSFPANGECKDGHTVNDGTCTSRTIKRVKTVSLDCLALDHNYTMTCRADGGPPYAKSLQSFEAIFESEDKSKGGCPAVTPPEPIPLSKQQQQQQQIPFPLSLSLPLHLHMFLFQRQKESIV